VTPNTTSAPLVSVIIPAYRRADFVNQAVASVLDQTFTDYEIIVVDDASGDEIVEQYDLPACARLIRRSENSGQPCAPRNDGYRVSRGKYIAFLDSDDTWAPDKLESQVAILDADPTIGVTFCHYTLIDESCQPLPKQHPALRLTGDALVAMIGLDYMFSPSFTLIRRTALEAEGVFDEEIYAAEDWDLFLRLARSWRFHFDPARRVFYRKHAGQHTSDGYRRARAGVAVIEKTLAWAAEHRPDVLPIVRQQAACRYNRLAGAQMKAGIPARVVRETLRHALVHDPRSLRVWCRRAALGLYGLRGGRPLPREGSDGE
jgi:glycosyltransferase involved in cell wall biosynthesis